MKGYYSLIQYAENPDRVEYVNIGVAVFSHSSKKLHLRFADNAGRVKKAFGVSLGPRYNMLTESFSNRLYEEFSHWESLSDLEYFVSNRSTKIRMTPLRAILLKDTEKDTDELFKRMVGNKPQTIRKQRVDLKLKKILQEKNVEGFLQHNPPVEINHFSIKTDYGYQNGKYNFIKSVSLLGEPNDALNKVSEFAV